MASGFDDGRHMTGKSSAWSYRSGRTVIRGLLRTIQQTKSKANFLGIQKGKFKDPLHPPPKRNEGCVSINLIRESSKPSFSSYQNGLAYLPRNKQRCLVDCASETVVARESAVVFR
ncbi:unnamed protein product [Protopolystoma xenopodis]|uniref:Uncharacterized protein n=1 Tax=Protopolystoma xenopodis TaxID=117903 RepID=A0A3S5B3H1_9PLAT|nr:unnamed protein product [Protopolystoma xenopodis]